MAWKLQSATPSPNSTTFFTWSALFLTVWPLLKRPPRSALVCSSINRYLSVKLNMLSHPTEHNVAYEWLQHWTNDADKHNFSQIHVGTKWEWLNFTVIWPPQLCTLQKMPSTSTQGAQTHLPADGEQGPRHHPCVVNDELYVRGRRVCDLANTWTGQKCSCSVGHIIYCLCWKALVQQLREHINTQLFCVILKTDKLVGKRMTGKGLRSAEGPGAEGEGNVTGFSVTTRLRKRSCFIALPRGFKLKLQVTTRFSVI